MSAEGNECDKGLAEARRMFRRYMAAYRGTTDPARKHAALFRAAEIAERFFEGRDQ